MGPEIVEVNFIVVDTYSPYTAIVGRPWLHTLIALPMYFRGWLSKGNANECPKGTH